MCFLKKVLLNMMRLTHLCQTLRILIYQVFFPLTLSARFVATSFAELFSIFLYFFNLILTDYGNPSSSLRIPMFLPVIMYVGLIGTLISVRVIKASGLDVISSSVF